MKRIAFQQVDVFTSTPFKGNPVAVVLDTEGLSTADMQTIANWTTCLKRRSLDGPTIPVWSKN